ncbi:carbohydrate porin [Rhodoblastus sp.]|uniref:carbohydrate porin n=1 Tax=Rhodoblastus sp. TaxID=1962975 RepID=UPI003F9C2897
MALAAGFSTGAQAADKPAEEKGASEEASAHDPWNGFYVGGHLGQAGGRSNWSGPDIWGTSGLAKAIDTFTETGSFLGGFQGGYNLLLPHNVLVGVETDFTFPAYPDLTGQSTGVTANFNSLTLGPASYMEALQAAGSVRGRVGYVFNDWLLYATGGFAWARTQQTLTQASSGTVDSPFVWRSGWVVGGGLEVPLIPNWRARLEYLYSNFGSKSVGFPNNNEVFRSDFALQTVRLGLNYQFGNLLPGAPAPAPAKEGRPSGWTLTDEDRVNFHAQGTFVGQGYPGIRATSDGPNSLPRAGGFRETNDVTLYAGLRLWQGAEMWINPEIDQGFGVGNTHGAAGFPSGESYKLGYAFPYTRVQRYFLRQTVNLGGEEQKVEADINQFAGTVTENRLVFTVGKFGIVDIFDTNKYANNPKNDFLNWALINAGTFDYAGDAWGFTYGAAAEWYQGRWTARAGIFDLSSVPAGGAFNGPAYGVDPNLSQFQAVGEIEERHELWGEPGKLKVTGFISRGRMGNFQDAVNAANWLGMDPSLALALDRKFRSRPGVSVNLEQQVSDNVGFFARAGYTDGSVEPWDFADIDRTVQAGVSISGKDWGRPDDTLGFAGIVNGLANSHEAYFAAGGLGILIGDGQLPAYGLEKILESYYNYALTPNIKVGLDYQLIVDPGYNATRGPANLFAARLHWQF